MDRNFLTVGCALCFATCSLATVARAAEPTSPIFEDVAAVNLQPVDDTVLASQSGKGIAGDIISGVVVNLLSQWNLPNGTTAVAQGALAIVTNTLNQVGVQVSSSASVVGPNTS